MLTLAHLCGEGSAGTRQDGAWALILLDSWGRATCWRTEGAKQTNLLPLALVAFGLERRLLPRSQVSGSLLPGSPWQAYLNTGPSAEVLLGKVGTFVHLRGREQRRRPGQWPQKECIPGSKAPWEGNRLTVRCPQMHGGVCAVGMGAGRGSEQAVTPRTTLGSLFSTRPLYLVSNISPGKRKHSSGQSLGNMLSSSVWFTWRLLGAPYSSSGTLWGGPGRGESSLHPLRRLCGSRSRWPSVPTCALTGRVTLTPAPLRRTPALLRESSGGKGHCDGFAAWASNPHALQFPQL